MRIRSLISGWSIGSLLALTALPAAAHHSFVGYDLSKSYTADATIKEFRWGAPHSTAVFVVHREGKDQEITVGSTTPALLFKAGFKPKDFKAGEKVQITWHPSKNGNLGGTLSTIKFPDGRTFTDHEFIGANDNQAGSAQPPTSAPAP